MPNEPSLNEIASRMGFREVPEILIAAATPIARGHHLALAAGRGAGSEAVYALAIGTFCKPESDLQALILVPSRDRAAEVAVSVQRAVGAAGLRVGTAPLRADGSLDVEAASVHCLVARPSLLLPEIRLGRLGLGELDLLILDGVADLEDLDEWTSVDPLLDTLKGEAKRVAVTRRVDERFQELVQRQLPRGRRWPDEPFEGAAAPDPLESGFFERIEVGLGATEEERIALLVEALAGCSDAWIRCRSESAVPVVSAALQSAGFHLEDPENGWDVAATSARAEETDGSVRAWFGLPLSLGALASGADGRAVAIVEPAHRAQLDILAARAGSSLQILPGSLPASELNPLGRYRSLVRSRIERGGTDAELLVIEPLVREFGTAAVAAALSDLLRRSADGISAIRPWADVEAATRGGDHAGGARPSSAGQAAGPRGKAGSSHRGARGSWSRVFIGAGSRDSVRVGDLVGAITGETGIAGAQIGKIEIRGSFSLVEIDSQVVDQVIDKLNGTTVRGREVTVKRDQAR